MKDFPFISIIIPAKNEEGLIGKCLDSLNKLNYPKDRLEVIISDGLSTDRTVEIAKSYGAKTVNNEAQTVSPGRNVGFLHSKGEFIAFSDADCVMEKDWIANSIKYFDDERVAGVGGPSMIPDNETYFGRAVRFLFLLGSLISNSVYVTDSKKAKKVESVPGCNAVYRREALKTIMPVDETLLTCDDVEMNYQLKVRGYKVLYAPDVIVWHYRRDNPKKLWKQIYRYAIGRLQIGKKHRDAIGLVHIIWGLAIPIFFSAITVFLFLRPSHMLLIAGALLILTIAFSLFIFTKEKSVKVVYNVFLAAVIFTFAWSAGFLKELFYPIKKTAGK